MKPEEYSPKVREAFGKSLIDIGVSIFKGIVLLITVVPVSLILKGALEPEGVEISIVTLVESMSSGTYLLFIGFLGFSFIAGGWFRAEGLWHIHKFKVGPISDSVIGRMTIIVNPSISIMVTDHAQLSTRIYTWRNLFFYS